jgi:hypothetical protein
MVLFSALPTNLGNRSSRFPHSHRHDYHGIIPKTSRLRDTHSEGKVKMEQKYQNKSTDWKQREPFYAAVLTDIRSISRAHRNPALHDIDRKYSDSDAKYLIEVTKAFMTHLADNGMKE